MAQLVFPYIAGEQFVDKPAGSRRRQVDGGRHRPSAFRPPASTEQVMHPQAYLEVEQPDASGRARPGRRARTGLARAAPRNARRVAHGAAARPGRRDRSGGDAAAGWGGDAYALLGDGDTRALVARWTWDTPDDADQFTGDAPGVGARGAARRRAGRGGCVDVRPDGAAAISRRGGDDHARAGARRPRPRGGRRGRASLLGGVRAGSSAVRAAGS